MNPRSSSIAFHLQQASTESVSRRICASLVLATTLAAISARQVEAQDRLADLKAEALAAVDRMSGFTQQMVDMVFSFGELGFQEVETSRYLVGILREHGFTIEEGIAGIPTAWIATWGSGRPVISLGSDLDGIPQSSQKPGVAFRAPLIEGAPGHGEGHNSGQAVNITAAVAVKEIMAREGLSGTIRIWPGVAEELLGTKAYLVRSGYFRGTDAVLFSHVSSNLSTSWGSASGSGLISVEFSFEGRTAHSAGSPWRGRSALDAIELMGIAWNFRREHLRPQHRVHYVIRDGGDQPNVVPRTASAWYYFREIDYPHIQELFAVGDSIARAAAMMTGTRLTQTRILGTAWPRHFNKPIALAMTKNIERIGLPTWSEADQSLAKAVQKELGQDDRGLDTTLRELAAPVDPEDNRGGGSDDIGDISWTVPTVTLRFPSNIPGLPGHHLVERDRHGDTAGTQGRDGRRQGAGPHHAGPAARARPGGQRMGILSGRSDEGNGLPATHPPG